MSNVHPAIPDVFAMFAPRQDRIEEFRVRYLSHDDRSVLVEHNGAKVRLFLAHVECGSVSEDGTMLVCAPARLARELGMME